MSTAHDIQKPDDQFGLVADNWPVESESAYATAERQATTASNIAQAQAQEATDGATKTDADMKGKTAESVSNGYSRSASQLHEQSVHYNAVSAWMADARGVVAGAKRRISTLVRAGTSEIRDALNSELSGTPATPSSSELITKHQREIAAVKTELTTELDSIGHSLAGDPGASRTPSYTSVSTKPTAERPDPHVSAASYTGDHHAPVPEPHQLPEMPRATTASTESPSTPSAPSSTGAPHITNPTLSNLISGGQSASPSGTPNSTSASSTKSPSSATSGAPAGQAHQANEQHQQIRPTDFPRIPSIPLSNAPAVAADIATAVTSSVGHQLPATSMTPATPLAPASTGITPGTSGTPPMPPGGLAPIGGLPTPPVVQAAPAVQGTPASPPAGVQTPSAPQTPASAPAPRGPVVDATWLQRTYGLSPSLELPKPENTHVPARFIADLPESEAHLHRVLATLRQEFGQSGWSQPLAVATIRRGFESRRVYVTSDGVSIHPHGVLLPAEVSPLSEMPTVPDRSDLSGSIMVTEKLTALIPRGWEVANLLSTVSADESHQSVEQYGELSEAGELLPCKVSRGREGVTAEEAMAVFARAAIGSGGCSDLDTESARLRATRWVGLQPSGYGEVLSRWYLSDAAECMGLGNWSDAVYCSEKYLGLFEPKIQAA